jgi:hypothetical protein
MIQYHCDITQGVDTQCVNVVNFGLPSSISTHKKKVHAAMKESYWPMSCSQL